MGKKSSSSSPAVDPRVGAAMEKQADILDQQQQWYENEIYPWLKEQTYLQNEWSQQDRQFAQENALWWRDMAKEQYDKQNERADEYYNRWKDVYKPIEDQLVADVDRYNTSAEAERQAQAAIGDYANAYAKQKQAQNMQMQSYGLNPTSGAYQAQNKALAFNQAGIEAMAANQARQAAEQLGWQKRMQMAAIGQQYIGNSQNQVNTATNASGSAGGLANQSIGQASQFGQLGTQNISNLANVGLQSYSALSNGWGQYGNLGMQVSNYNQNAWAQNQQNKAQNAAGVGSMVGGIATAAAVAF